MSAALADTYDIYGDNHYAPPPSPFGVLFPSSCWLSTSPGQVIKRIIDTNEASDLLALGNYCERLQLPPNSPPPPASSPYITHSYPLPLPAWVNLSLATSSSHLHFQFLHPLSWHNKLPLGILNISPPSSMGAVRGEAGACRRVLCVFFYSFLPLS